MWEQQVGWESGGPQVNPTWAECGLWAASWTALFRARHPPQNFHSAPPDAPSSPQPQTRGLLRNSYADTFLNANTFFNPPQDGYVAFRDPLCHFGFLP